MLSGYYTGQVPGCRSGIRNKLLGVLDRSAIKLHIQRDQKVLLMSFWKYNVFEFVFFLIKSYLLFEQSTSIDSYFIFVCQLFFFCQNCSRYLECENQAIFWSVSVWCHLILCPINNPMYINYKQMFCSIWAPIPVLTETFL